MRRSEYAFMFLDFKWIKYVCLLFLFPYVNFKGYS